MAAASAPGRLAWPQERTARSALTAPMGWLRHAVGPSRPDRRARMLGWFAAASIGGAILVMLGLSVAGPSRAVVPLRRSQAGPLLFFQLHPSQMLVTCATWSAVVVGGTGVAAALAAVTRGARPSPRLLAGVALAVAALFTVLPPAGSTDSLDYASYGRMVAVGHDPYVMTPRQLRLSGDPIGRVAPRPWQDVHSVYGPLATLEQAAAAELGGTSPGWIVFWLKLWNLLAFGAVVIALHRLLRRHPVRRARAHLLWSLNPLLLWALLAAGHIDAFAAGFGFLGLLVLRPGDARAGGVAGRWWDRWLEGWWDSWSQGAPADPGPWRGLIAGGLIGAAADLKITFALFGVGAAWAARRSLRTLAALAGGALAVLVPSYLWFGPPAITALLTHSSVTSDNLYRVFADALGTASLPQLSMVALPVFAATAWLLLRWLPDGFPELPAVRPAFALSLAWLLTWPYQRPWYDAMAFCLLALYPASRLDWPLLARLVAGLLFSAPGMPGNLTEYPLGTIQHTLTVFVVPLIRLSALIAVVLLCLAARRAHQQVNARTTAGAPMGPSARGNGDAQPARGSAAGCPPAADWQGRR